MDEQKNRKKMILADISLLFVALFWGSNYVVMKQAFEVIEPFTYLGIRFCLAALLLALLFWKRLRKAPPGDYLAGCLIGLFLFTGFVFTTIGLLHTTPAKAGFITGITVVIVPFLYYLVTRRSPGWWSFLGGGLAAVGLYLLAANETMGLGFGDLMVLISAFLFAAQLVAIAIYVRKRDPIVLSTTQIAFTGLGSFVVALIFEPTGNMFSHPMVIWGAILYAVVFCTIGAFVTQTVAQRYTPPTHAVLVLSTEAVFAGIFSYFFWGEIFTLQKLSGGLLILASILLTELHPMLSARYSAYRIAATRRGLPPME